MSNSRGTLSSNWHAFDQLPKSVREALANAAFNWAPGPIAREWNKGRWPNAKTVCKLIEQWDQKAIRRPKP